MTHPTIQDQVAAAARGYAIQAAGCGAPPEVVKTATGRFVKAATTQMTRFGRAATAILGRESILFRTSAPAA